MTSSRGRPPRGASAAQTANPSHHLKKGKRKKKASHSHRASCHHRRPRSTSSALPPRQARQIRRALFPRAHVSVDGPRRLIVGTVPSGIA